MSRKASCDRFIVADPHHRESTTTMVYNSLYCSTQRVQRAAGGSGGAGEKMVSHTSYFHSFRGVRDRPSLAFRFIF